ncbi:hypothetical protein LTR50_004902 [Elasticomyces elasticus]|nr:hypothetical protein LTR50_004902 [Elasticomyces elasticus]
MPAGQGRKGNVRPFKPHHTVLCPNGMSSSPSAITPAALRSLLRQLLRECTYLPDPAARSYLSVHVLSRFRDYHPNAVSLPVTKARSDTILSKARQSLSALKRANDGELKPLLKVLCLTYGRTGRRRRELLKPLMEVSDAPTGSSEPTPASGDVSASMVSDRTADHDTGVSRLPELNKKLRALLHSQMQQAPPEMTRINPRNLTLRIPEQNTWMRPLPRKRVANSTRDWYAAMLQRVLPPLPTKEWERLRDLATGRVTFEGVRHKRAQACRTESGTRLSPHGQCASTSADAALHAPLPPGALERSLGLSPPLIKRKPNRDYGQGHNISARYMRRCWAQVFLQCPRMDWNREWQKWEVEWGKIDGYELPRRLADIRTTAGAILAQDEVSEDDDDLVSAKDALTSVD